MTPLTTAPPPPPAAHGVSDDLTAHEEMQLELLEELPVRLEPEALAAILGLHEQGKTPKTIGGAMSLHRVVVTLELRRERSAAPASGKRGLRPASTMRRSCLA